MRWSDTSTADQGRQGMGGCSLGVIAGQVRQVEVGFLLLEAAGERRGGRDGCEKLGTWVVDEGLQKFQGLTRKGG